MNSLPDDQKSHCKAPSAEEKIKAANRKAAHELLTELRTRISTQKLPYQHGVESRALESLWELFALARKAIRDNPGCVDFADRTTEVLNCQVRPLTAKWHRALSEGRLASRDGADQFRGELQKVQDQLCVFASELHKMAYDVPYMDKQAAPVMSDAVLDALFDKKLKFGFCVPKGVETALPPEIAKDEAVAVKDRRTHQHITVTEEGTNAIGLALSGGGIRSASFGLGVVQVLAEKKFLKEVDFLSTVSGGGYTGSFLTRRLGDGAGLTEVASPDGPDPDPVAYLRQNVRFLSADNLKARWAMVCSTVAGMLLNWTAPALIILLLAIFARWWGAVFVDARHDLLQIGAVVTGIALVIYGIGMRCKKAWCRQLTAWIFAAVLALTLVVGLTELLDLAFYRWPARISGWTKAATGLLAAAGGVAVVFPAIMRYLPILKNPAVRKIALKVAMMIAGIVVPLLGILGFYALLEVHENHLPILYGAAGLLMFVSLIVLNVNLTGPHRLYRDALARTFVQKEVKDDAPVPLKDINATGNAPYHIINTALNVPGTTNPVLKDRGCDFFMFTKGWSGSATVGYQKTEQWDNMDLGTAMAVSGAAFSSHMGLGAMPSLTALLTFLNVRLGYWIKVPGRRGIGGPGFLCLMREMFGLEMSEKRSWLNLSDGGHIENLAVYELLRRRCKFIICVDGEADPAFTFHGLMTLVRHARIDFGVNIRPALGDLRPDPATGLSKSHFHFCRVEYAPGETGLLLYLKLSVTGDESELIRRYRTVHPEFPHQTTLDQFFDQEQFEAYRSLGAHAAGTLFRDALMDGKKVGSVPEWFRQLARNLLEPSV